MRRTGRRGRKRKEKQLNCSFKNILLLLNFKWNVSGKGKGTRTLEVLCLGQKGPSGVA